MFKSSNAENLTKNKKIQKFTSPNIQVTWLSQTPSGIRWAQSSDELPLVV
jgi:hypothetical protein